MSPMFEIWARPDYRQTLVSLGLSPKTADSVVGAWPDPASLSAATAAQLQRHGVTAHQARRLFGAVDLAKLAHGGRLVGPRILNPVDAYGLVGPVLAMSEAEVLAVILLDTKCRVIDVLALTQGGTTMVVASPRDVFRAAVRAAAVSVVVAHNHPSGDPMPSPADLELTRRLVDAGRVVGIPVLDHLVIARGGEYRSLSEEGLM